MVATVLLLSLCWLVEEVCAEGEVRKTRSVEGWKVSQLALRDAGRGKVRRTRGGGADEAKVPSAQEGEEGERAHKD